MRSGPRPTRPRWRTGGRRSSLPPRTDPGPGQSLASSFRPASTAGTSSSRVQVFTNGRGGAAATRLRPVRWSGQASDEILVGPPCSDSLMARQGVGLWMFLRKPPRKLDPPLKVATVAGRTSQNSDLRSSGVQPVLAGSGAPVGVGRSAPPGSGPQSSRARVQLADNLRGHPGRPAGSQSSTFNSGDRLMGRRRG